VRVIPARTRLALALALGASAVVLAAAPAAMGRGLLLGVADNFFHSSDAGTRSAWFDRAERARAGMVMLSAVWASIAPQRPANPANPNDPAYSWGALDGAVRDANSRGLKVMLQVTRAPRWAEGPNRPGIGVAEAGTWLPDPSAYGQFARAIAARYPGVDYWYVWGEPNVSLQLNPQLRGGRLVSAAHYRKMLNAFYAGIKSVSGGDRVIGGTTSPYGVRVPGLTAIAPARFWRALLSGRARFDIAGHNPLNVGEPERHAINRDDIATPDIGKLRRILRRAGKGSKPIWATELWWDSRPPDPDGVPRRLHARWVEQALYVLWRQGVRAVVWFYLADTPPAPSYGSTLQSGLYFRGGGAKLALRAFRFPFVADRLGPSRVRIWGKAPSGAGVAVQRKGGGGWRTIKHLGAGGDRVFVGTLRLRGRAVLRARAAGETSLPWGLK
jgi:hypothetical protein